MASVPMNLIDFMGCKTTVCFSSRTEKVFIRGKSLVWVNGSQEEKSVALGDIRRVILLGKARVDTSILYKFTGLGIVVDWLDIFGNPRGQLLSLGEYQHEFPEKQNTFAKSKEALELARACLIAKVDNCHEVLRRKMAISPQWKEARLGLTTAKTPDSLRGAEGFAARLYFSHWPVLLPGFSWPGRCAHPAPDPINMLLSLGYGLLHNRLASSLYWAGLNPRMGFFHMGRGKHWALASDLMEPLRAVVDATVLALIRHKRVTPEQFIKRAEKCSAKDRNTFSFILGAFEEMFARIHSFSHNRNERKRTLSDILDDVAISFASFLKHGTPCLIPELS